MSAGTRARLKVGFIGLGDQGEPMARRIRAAGFPLHVFDRRPAAIEPFLGTGVTVHRSASELAAACDLVGICVTLESDVEEVVFNDAGVLRGISRGGIIAVHSSATPELLVRIERSARAVGARALDAPVSGARPGAEAGTMCVMVGGEAEVLALARPVFDSFASVVVRVGAMGAGQLAKLLNNNLLFANMVLAMAAIDLGSRLGLDESTTGEVLAASSGASFGLEMVRSEYEIGRMAKQPAAITDHIDHLRAELARRGIADADGLMALSAAVGSRSRDFVRRHTGESQLLRDQPVLPQTVTAVA